MYNYGQEKTKKQKEAEELMKEANYEASRENKEAIAAGQAGAKKELKAILSDKAVSFHDH